jgi:hypothetical protein
LRHRAAQRAPGLINQRSGAGWATGLWQIHKL